MFCCMGGGQKKPSSSQLPDLKKEKVYLSLSPELTFEFDEKCTWNFTGVSQNDNGDEAKQRVKELRE
jgi:hypothetical protein